MATKLYRKGGSVKICFKKNDRRYRWFHKRVSYRVMSLNQNGFSLRVLNNLGIEVDKVNRKHCKIVDELKANRVKGWVLQRVKFINFSFYCNC